MTESMRRYTVILLRILDKASETGEPIDVFNLMSRFTIEAFAKMGFGIDMNCLESEQDHPFTHAFDSAQRVLNLGNEAQLKKDVAVIDKTVIDIVAQSLERREKRSVDESVNIVGLFLDRFDGSNGEKLDLTYLRDVVVNFLIAGRDTTAQALTWCIYNLSRHPEVVAKIRDEIQRVLPDFASGKATEIPTIEDVNVRPTTESQRTSRRIHRHGLDIKDTSC